MRPKYLGAFIAFDKFDELGHFIVIPTLFGPGDGGVSVNCKLRLRGDHIGNIGVVDLPVVPDQPCVKARVFFPSVACVTTVRGQIVDVRAKRMHGRYVGHAANDIFPHANLTGAVHHH